jgi:hypothetical protein
MWLLGFELWTFGRAVRCSYPLSHLTSPYRGDLEAYTGYESQEIKIGSSLSQGHLGQSKSQIQAW